MANQPQARSGLFTVALVLLAGYMGWLLVRPFVEVFFLAAVLAAALHPIMVRLQRLFRGRKSLAAVTVSVGLVLLGVVPLVFVLGVLVRQGIQGYDWVSATLRSQGMAGLLAHLPDALRGPVEEGLAQLPKTSADVLALVRSQGGAVAALVTGALSLTGKVLLQFVAFLVAFFFLLTDGGELVAWARGALPLSRKQFDLFLEEFRQVTRATLASTVATAGIQAAVALVGYWIAGVPQALFFFVVTFLVALIPAVGAGAVVLVLAALKLATGHAVAAAFLAGWGILFVGLSDNLVKPLLLRGSVKIHGGILFFSLLGGIFAFGAVGILAGPLVAAFFLAVVRMVKAEREEKQAPPAKAKA